jgi:hypothetical protein
MHSSKERRVITVIQDVLEQQVILAGVRWIRDHVREQGENVLHNLKHHLLGCTEGRRGPVGRESRRLSHVMVTVTESPTNLSCKTSEPQAKCELEEGKSLEAKIHACKETVRVFQVW